MVEGCHGERLRLDDPHAAERPAALQMSRRACITDASESAGDSGGINRGTPESHTSFTKQKGGGHLPIAFFHALQTLASAAALVVVVVVVRARTNWTYEPAACERIWSSPACSIPVRLQTQNARQNESGHDDHRTQLQQQQQQQQ